MHTSKLLGYVRNDSDKNTLAEQENEIRKFAKENNYEVVKIFSDHGKSAKDFGRTGLEAMLKYAFGSTQRVKALVIVSHDILSRSISELRTIKQFLRDTKIRLIFLSDLKLRYTGKPAKK
jgi:DNA invertase Pin-like site-specific DNA recombinase